MKKVMKDTVEGIMKLGDTFKSKAEPKVDFKFNTDEAVTLLSTVMTPKGRIQATIDVTEAICENRVTFTPALAAVYGSLAKETNTEVSRDAIKAIVNIAKYTPRDGEVTVCLETLLDVAGTAENKKIICRAIQGAANIFMEKTEHASDTINKKFQDLRKTDKERAPERNLLLHAFARVTKVEHVPPTITAALDELQIAYDTSAIDKFKRLTNPKWGMMHAQQEPEKTALPPAINSPEGP